MMKKRIIFMGSPEFSVPILYELHNQFSVVGVVSQPDRPAGRGRVMTPCPVMQFAIANGLPSIQPEKLYRNVEALKQVDAWNPDLIVVAAYGKVLRKEILDRPEFGCINVHASLLPRWRGASPIQAAIFNGDGFTGISIMKMDTGLDTGAILSQKKIPIEPSDTSGTLERKLSCLGAELLVETLPKYFSSEIEIVMQDEKLATYAPLLKKADGDMDFCQSAEELNRMVRAYNPWPGSFTTLNQLTIKIHDTATSNLARAVPGKMMIIEGLPAIGTKNGWLVLRELQPAGKKRLNGESFLMGHREWSGFIDGYEGNCR